MTERPVEESNALATVRRWERSGGTWRILARRPDGLTISLCRCDGGEEADRLSSGAVDLRAYVGERDRSD